MIAAGRSSRSTAPSTSRRRRSLELVDGETTTAAAVREVREETGLDVEVTGLVGIYSDPRHVIAYDDGEVRQEFSICFRARPIGGQLAPSSESTHVDWVKRDRLDDLNIHRSVRLRIDHGLQQGSEPYLS